MNLNQSQGLEKPKIEEIKTPENKIKEGVDFVFEQNPELAQIGNKEQYSEYLDTIFPESKVQNICYHGSGDGRKDEFNKKENAEKGSRKSVTFFARDKNLSKAFIRDDMNSTSITSVILNIKTPFTFEVLTEEQKSKLKELDERLAIEHGVNPEFAKKRSYRFLENLKEKRWEDFTGNKYLPKFLVDEGFDSWYECQGYVPGKGRYENIAVFEPSQIYILGSKNDIENFKEFVSKNKE